MVVFDLVGVYLGTISHKYRFVGVLMEGPKQYFYFNSSYYKGNSTFVNKSFYFRKERFISLDSSYLSYGVSYNLVSFYYQYKPLKIFNFISTYKVKNYEKYVFYGRNTIAKITSFKLKGLFNKKSFSFVFCLSRYTKYSFGKVFLNSSYSQQIIKSNTVSFNFTGSFIAFKKFYFFNVDEFLLQVELFINVLKNKKVMSFEDENYKLFVLKASTSTRNFISKAVVFSCKVFIDTMPYYFGFKAKHYNYESRRNFLKKFVVFSATGFYMEDFYGPRMNLIVRRDIYDYKLTDEDLSKININFQNIKFTLTKQFNFIFPDVYRLSTYRIKNMFSFIKKDIIFKLSDMKYMLNSHIDKVQWSTIDSKNNFSYVSLKFVFKKTTLHFKQTGLFKLFTKYMFAIGTYKRILYKWAQDYFDTDIFFKEIKAISKAKTISLFYVNKTSYYGLFKFYQIKKINVFSIQFIITNAAFSKFNGNVFRMNLHRSFYVNEDVYVLNSFIEKKEEIVNTDGLLYKGEYKHKDRTDDFMFEIYCSIVVPKIIVSNEEGVTIESFYNYFVTLIPPQKTNDFYKLLRFIPGKGAYKIDVKKFIFDIKCEINSYNFDYVLYDLLELNVRKR